MAAITPATVHAALAAVLKIDEAALPASWDDLCARAAPYANGTVQGELMSRGFRLAEDVLAWDRYAEFARDLGVWYCLSNGGAYAGFDARTVAAMDRHAELKTVFVLVNGALVSPASGRPGTAVVGGQLDQSGGQFVYDPSRPHQGIEF